jgi:tRNA G18 (ribose-2'-O)-methylase SpoU
VFKSALIRGKKESLNVAVAFRIVAYDLRLKIENFN